MNRLENFRGRITGPKARVAALGIAVATVGAACTPEQIAMVESAFPCPPRDIAGIGETGTGTEPVSGEREDSQTAVAQNRLLTIELPAFLTNREEIVICIPTAPTGEQAIARPTPTPEVDVTNYSVKAFLKLEDKKIKISEFYKIIGETSPVLVEFRKNHGFPRADTESLIRTIKAETKQMLRHPSMDYAGFRIANKVVAAIEEAQFSLQEGDHNAAKASLDAAEAYVRLGKTLLPSNAIDNEIKRVARQLGVN